MKPLIVVAAITFFLYLSPLFFIFADLWSGIRKARLRGEAITSYKTRRTVYKINKYYNCLLALSVLDALQIAPLWYVDTYHGARAILFPFVTLLGAVGIGIIETKSILEPATAKEEKETGELLEQIEHILADGREPAKVIADLLTAIYGKKGKGK
ncbi:MAG: hypothetical protein LUC22_02750 [Prevotella sp.]|nr:hypothetical protein [Prevotella sp.]